MAQEGRGVGVEMKRLFMSPALFVPVSTGTCRSFDGLDDLPLVGHSSMEACCARQVRCRFAFCYLLTFLLKQDSKNKENVKTLTLKKLQFREILDLVRKTLYRELKIDLATPG